MCRRRYLTRPEQNRDLLDFVLGVSFSSPLLQGKSLESSQNFGFSRRCVMVSTVGFLGFFLGGCLELGSAHPLIGYGRKCPQTENPPKLPKKYKISPPPTGSTRSLRGWDLEGSKLKRIVRSENQGKCPPSRFCPHS